MKSRRIFIKQGMLGAVWGSVLSSPVASLASPWGNMRPLIDTPKLRFAIASDGHYGQPDTPYAENHDNIVRWLTAENQEQPLDFIIINGDLVHDRPDLLNEVKTKYFDLFPVPYYTIPGNHDHADAALWLRNFGYEDNYTFRKGDTGFILANTADTNGKYVAPNYDFLEKELKKMQDLPVILVILHIPPHMWVPENPFVDSPKTVDLLHQFSNVKAVFHGHDHTLDSVFYTSKLPHFFDSHFGGNWGTHYKGYRIVEIGKDNRIHTYQVNASNDPILNRSTIQ